MGTNEDLLWLQVYVFKGTLGQHENHNLMRNLYIAPVHARKLCLLVQVYTYHEWISSFMYMNLVG